jgi:hypothetical protein
MKDKPLKFFLVREKYGGLNFQFDGEADAEAAAAIKEATDASWVTCTICAAPGTL